MVDNNFPVNEWDPNRRGYRGNRKERPPKEHQSFHVGQAAKGLSESLRHIQTLVRHYDDSPEPPNFEKETLFAIQTNLVQSISLMMEIQQGVG